MHCMTPILVQFLLHKNLIGERDSFNKNSVRPQFSFNVFVVKNTWLLYMKSLYKVLAHIVIMILFNYSLDLHINQAFLQFSCNVKVFESKACKNKPEVYVYYLVEVLSFWCFCTIVKIFCACTLKR